TDNAYVAEAMQWIDNGPTESPAPADPGARSRPLILVADDNSDMRAHLQRILSQRWDTVTFPDGSTALDGVRRHRPDAVITDVMMPGLDGFGLVAALRNDSAVA